MSGDGGREGSAQQRRLLRIAEAITNGARVDWEAERVDGAAAETELANLKALEAMAEAHGGLEAPRPAPAAPPAAPRPEPAIGAWGPLQLLERIGAGSFAEVYRAYDPTLQRQVALKLRSPRRAAHDPIARRFVREARMLARVHHPNVLVVHGADQHDDRAGLWTDLLRGRTLEQILLDQGPFSAREAALIGIDMCGALASVHAAGLVHRDVKTANIMREQGGRIVLTDFGSGGERANCGPAAAHLSSGGTPLYMAPEQLLEAAEASAASDLYALGVVLYRLVTGRHPIEAESLPDLIEKHRRREGVSLVDARPDLPPTYVHAVERALARNPIRRYHSAGSMERDLRAVLGAGYISTPHFEGGG